MAAITLFNRRLFLWFSSLAVLLDWLTEVGASPSSGISVALFFFPNNTEHYWGQREDEMKLILLWRILFGFFWKILSYGRLLAGVGGRLTGCWWQKEGEFAKSWVEFCLYRQGTCSLMVTVVTSSQGRGQETAKGKVLASIAGTFEKVPRPTWKVVEGQ